MSHHKLEIKKLRFSYPDGHRAIDQVSFEIHHGESVGIIGANGAGKSTLLKLLMGVHFPEEGEVAVADVKVTKKTLAFIRQRMGFVFQNPDDQLFMNSVYEDVAFGPRNYGMDEQEVQRRVDMALEVVGIPHLRNREPYKLSGGEKRAAAIATVLAMEPDILIMDEPTDALDPKARRRLIGLLKGFDHTKVITSHDLDMVYEVCARVLILSNGRIVADGETRELLEDEALMEKWGLELPLCLQGKKNIK